MNTVSALSAVNDSGYFINHLAQIPDSAYLIITHKGLQSSAANYASYRSTTGFNTYVVYVDELYRQLAYGINKHPLALRNFIDYLAQNNKLPSYVFLIGKSIKAKEYRKNATNYANNLVPSYGNPTSDILLFAGLNGGLFEPPMPVGRLAAKNATEVTWYLNKVIQHENPLTGPNGETEWMKRVLHFAG
ncbi:MAG: C25 family cysteine peptidase, partial [Sulfurovum sp.]|nr:C25 family cysteine peptidase [Sulfurovum sp.]